MQSTTINSHAEAHFPTMPSPQPADVFVSYSREDVGRVTDLVAKLRAAGVSLWIDQGSLDAASQWSEQIVNALESSGGAFPQRRQGSGAGE
jgi:hypothetical protein